MNAFGVLVGLKTDRKTTAAPQLSIFDSDSARNDLNKLSEVQVEVKHLHFAVYCAHLKILSASSWEILSFFVIFHRPNHFPSSIHYD